MLREEFKPAHAVLVKSVTGIKRNLRFINDDNTLMFVALVAVEVFPGILLELVNVHFKRRDIDKFALVLFRV